ncbi:MAG: HAD family hydrolase [Bacillus sp. (in: Bacteria)]|nr:HAD family hydrolase [Bacillus sp. (in: firmicutes)]MCM1425227.1 HAD family hydrolase [Eubacterium sp.]
MIENIKWIFFDIGSTLADESVVYENRMRKIAKLANVTYEYVYETAVKFYKENKKGDLEVIKLFNVEAPEWNPEDEMLYGDAEECLKLMHRKYKIGIIANQVPGTTKRLENFGILKYIDLVVASAEEGVAKPDKRIFEIALHRADCEPRQAVMIGDRIDNDIVPAKKLGMSTIWIKQGFGRYWNITREEEKADYEVNSLMEICGVI